MHRGPIYSSADLSRATPDSTKAMCRRRSSLWPRILWCRKRLSWSSGRSRLRSCQGAPLSSRSAGRRMERLLSAAARAWQTPHLRLTPRLSLRTNASELAARSAARGACSLSHPSYFVMFRHVNSEHCGSARCQSPLPTRARVKHTAWAMEEALRGARSLDDGAWRRHARMDRIAAGGCSSKGAVLESGREAAHALPRMKYSISTTYVVRDKHV